VKALKYGRWRELARPMGHAMVPSARVLVCGSEPLLVPVPLSVARERERGFNQAGLLARALASKTGWQWRSLLERRAGGRRQARLARHARSENVRELFRALRVDDTSADVLVVDDVFTTGATARACAQTLREAGFGRVSVVTFARTLRPLEVTDDAGPEGARI
jgi:ComF family protein